MNGTEFDIQFDMMEMGQDINTALSEGDLLALQSLLHRGHPDLSRSDKKGRTVLHIAACRGMREAVSLLLENGANPNVTDVYGNTPLHWCGHLETIDVLIEGGASVLIRNKTGATPRMMAARRGVSEDVIHMFERHEAELSLDAEPLLPGGDVSSISTRINCAGKAKEKIENVQSIWYEFCVDLGPQKLILLVLTVLLMSLYVAFTVTGITKHIESRIPVMEGGVHKVEL